jgi:glycerol-3-phosphate dehydrogenase
VSPTRRTLGEPFDLVVCGGGITGAGIARDAAQRGLRVALVDKSDFGAGTSSKSSKLVHGGLRYLEHYEFKLVFEGTNERALQMKRAPHLVRPIPFMFPVYRWARPGLKTMDIGLWLYDGLAMFKNRLHKTYRSGKRVRAKEPALGDHGLVGGIEYVDCLTDDARLTLENVLDAKHLGAEVMSYTRVVGFERDERGRIAGVRVRRELADTGHAAGEERVLPTRVAVVAAGPWTDELLGEGGVDFGHKLLRPTKGVHIVVDVARVPITRAITFTTRDRRVVFAIPWVERTVIGTTDTDFHGDPDRVEAELADVTYLCDAANHVFPEAKLGPSDVIATWAGLRPLVAPAQEDGVRASDVSREHEVFVRDEGVVVIAGGKLTTYRRMAKEVVDRTVEHLHDRGDAILDGREIKRCRTKHRPLPGARGLEPKGEAGVRALAESLGARGAALGVDARIAEHLAQSYGVRAMSVLERAQSEPALAARIDPELPYVWAEIDHAVDADLARTIDDVLVRRVPLALRSRGQGLGVLERVAARMAARLAWSAAETARQIEAYRAFIAGTTRFRTEMAANTGAERPARPARPQP